VISGRWDLQATISSVTVQITQATFLVLLENVEKMAGVGDDCLHRRAFGAYQSDL